MKQKYSKYSEYYFGVKELEEEEKPSFPRVINGIKIPQVEIVPEPKLNLQAKVEKPVEKIEYVNYEKRKEIILDILLVVFIIFFFLIVTNAIYIDLQLHGII